MDDRLSRQDEERIDGIRAATMRMHEFLLGLTETYVQLDPAAEALDADDATRGDSLIEEIAATWREAEIAEVTDPAVEAKVGSKRVHDLVGAIEDSLILARSSDPATRGIGCMRSSKRPTSFRIYGPRKRD